MGSVPDLKNPILGTQMIPKSSKIQPFSSGKAPDAPPGAPKASWTAYTAADCTLPPGTLGITLSAPAPAPGPGETTFTYYFLPLSLYLLPSTMCLLVDPHATSLVPRGRRIRKGCALCRRPRRRKNTSHSNSNFNQVKIKNSFIFNASLSNLKQMGSVPDLKNTILGTKKLSR